MLSERSKELRRAAIKLSKANGGYHYGGSFSCAEILIALYDHILTPNDRFILSKGHGCWVYYALLLERGFAPVLEGHPHRDPANGIHCTTGSMGHGLPFGVGTALALRLRNRAGRVFVLMGDGECQEGTTWEALLIAGKLRLGNLMVIVDNNRIQGSDFVENVLPVTAPLRAAAAESGWTVKAVDGHSVDDLKCELAQSGFPTLIIADTIKGKGVSFMEGVVKWHSNWLAGDLEKQAMEELA